MRGNSPSRLLEFLGSLLRRSSPCDDGADEPCVDWCLGSREHLREPVLLLPGRRLGYEPRRRRRRRMRWVPGGGSGGGNYDASPSGSRNNPTFDIPRFLGGHFMDHGPGNGVGTAGGGPSFDIRTFRKLGGASSHAQASGADRLFLPLQNKSGGE